MLDRVFYNLLCSLRSTRDLAFVWHSHILIHKRRDFQDLDFYLFAILAREPVAILADGRIAARAGLSVGFRDHFAVTMAGDKFFRARNIYQ
jgi:hypothetical protein